MTAAEWVRSPERGVWQAEVAGTVLTVTCLSVDRWVPEAGDRRGPEAWALFMLDDLRVGQQAINLAGECVSLADAQGGDSAGVRAGVRRTPLSTADRVRAAWAHLSHPKNAAKYSPAQLSTLKAKVRALARQHGVDIEDPDDEHESEHQGNEGPKPKPGKRHTRPVQVKRRGQYPVGEGSGADGGAGASGGEMAASAGYMKLAQAAEDGDPAAIALAGNRDTANYNPAVGPFGGDVSVLMREPPFKVHEVDRDDTEQDTRTTDEVARLLALADNVMGREKPHGSGSHHPAQDHRAAPS